MKQKRMVAMILAGGRGTRLYDLTKKVAKPAVHFGGKYRIIDFPLSNCANSNVSTVGVLVQYESVLLNSYIARDYVWGLDVPNGGVFCLPPREKDESGLGLYRGTADAITQNLDFLDLQNAEYVLILSGDHIYKMNYDKMLDAHIKNGADATIAVLEVPMSEASRFGIMNCDEDDNIVEFEEKPKEPKSNLASMGIYIFTYKTLRKYLKDDEKRNDSAHDFGKDIIPAYLNDGLKLLAYRFKGYWKVWEANMDLIKNSGELNLSDPDWKIYTGDNNAVPQQIGPNAKINVAYITQGCLVDGEVTRSVLFTGATVGEGAKVCDSVIMNNAKVSKGASLTRCLVMDDVVVPEGLKLGSKNSKDILLVTKALVNKKVGNK